MRPWIAVFHPMPCSFHSGLKHCNKAPYPLWLLSAWDPASSPCAAASSDLPATMGPPGAAAEAVCVRGGSSAPDRPAPSGRRAAGAGCAQAPSNRQPGGGALHLCARPPPLAASGGRLRSIAACLRPPRRLLGGAHQGAPGISRIACTKIWCGMEEVLPGTSMHWPLAAGDQWQRQLPRGATDPRPSLAPSCVHAIASSRISYTALLGGRAVS